MRKYHQKDCTTEHFSSGQKRSRLQNSVQPISELLQVKMHAKLQTNITGKEFTFSEYNALLQSAAAQYDASLTNAKRPRQAVYMTSVDSPIDQCDPDPDTSIQPYNFDCSIDTIVAYSRQPRESQPYNNARFSYRLQNIHLMDPKPTPVLHACPRGSYFLE